MNTSFRPHESAGIDDGLRTRLEGQIELLEDALPLLDSLRHLLARAENSKDDLGTLHECVNQLPRIEEAIDKANRHEQAHGLTQAVGARKEQALIAANERLVTLGQAAQPSLRAAVSAILELVKRQGVAPQPSELRLMESPGPAWYLSLVLSMFVASALFLLEWPVLSVLFGALTCILTLYLYREATPWILMPDRLFLPARWPRLARQVAPGSFKSISVQEGNNSVTLTLEQETLVLHSLVPLELASRLRLLSSSWLSPLQSPARAFVIADAVDDSTQQKGGALLSREGLLFVPSERTALVVKALTTQKLEKEPKLEEVLELIAHLPEGRWAAVGEHLEKSADAIWLPSDDAEVEEKVVRAGEKRVRLLLSNNPRRLEVEQLLKAF